MANKTIDLREKGTSVEYVRGERNTGRRGSSEGAKKEPVKTNDVQMYVRVTYTFVSASVRVYAFYTFG